MRTGAAAGHQGCYHEAVCYGSDEELLAVVRPFLLDGVSAGEPTMVALGERTAALVRAVLPGNVPVSFLAPVAPDTRPTVAIRAYRRILDTLVADGARQIRVLGELHPMAFGATWDWWARYEAAMNRVYDEYPLWSVCAYDLRATPAAVLADVARTHPRLVTVGGRRLPSPGYRDPVEYLAEPRLAPVDPLQLTPPVVELLDPTPVQARAAVSAADDGRLPVDAVEDLVMAVSEAVTNALRHGRPPVFLRLWVGVDRTVVTVSDGGSGPLDPFAGLVPPAGDAPGGLGLWITHQSCSHVTMERAAGAFTLRLTAGNPHFLD
ncbi:transcriptional regulator [Micromonospora rosaria]|uniref:Transcriptional regulator n=1 Tax=Micromonospora rosaria TaxID=47874 RepID=A0A136PLR7_9ACTN|nr:anti-sigma factor RsbA family regulatory protein [Micromonospora rosaria]KXK59313.1 transcriptional regulator [Micromonospora rosaria]